VESGSIPKDKALHGRGGRIWGAVGGDSSSSSIREPKRMLFNCPRCGKTSLSVLRSFSKRRLDIDCHVCNLKSSIAMPNNRYYNVYQGYDKFIANYYGKRNSTRNVDESNNFIVEFNSQDKLIEIYAKDFFFQRAFKLRFNKDETKIIINFLAMARNMMGNKQITNIGEINNFVVDYDGNQRIVTVYEKPTKECPVKLGFNDETEITAVIDFLVKAKSLF
jgi:transcription elongation factor Elf1